MMNLLEYGARFDNLVFQKDNIPESCLIVYSKDRGTISSKRHCGKCPWGLGNHSDDETWIVNYLDTDEVKKLVEYLELYLKEVQ